VYVVDIFKDILEYIGLLEERQKAFYFGQLIGAALNRRGGISGLWRGYP
jgi:hypothetical protein